MKSIELESPSKTPDNKLTFRIAEAHTVLFAGLAVGATVEFATTHRLKRKKALFSLAL